MRQDKLTTKFQQALADAQSLALGHDNTTIEPQHLLLALLQQDDGATTSLLAQAGTNVQALKTALDQALSRPAICLTAFMAKVRVRPMATPAIRQG